MTKRLLSFNNTGNNDIAHPLRRLALFCVLILLIITQTGCSSDSSQPVTGENYYLDTVCTISIYEITGEDGKAVPASDQEEAAGEVIKKAWDLCAGLEKKLSRTQDASEISRLNHAGGEFDITIGGVTDLWDFHADPEDAKVPDEEDLAEAVKHVDYHLIETDGNKVRIRDPETKIDLGGIAKGYIGDRMTELLEAEGVTSGIINLGGNVICIGAKDNDAEGDEGAFVIGVEAPFSDRSELVGKVNAKDMTLVTSGVYERRIEVDGKRYHHILSTDTGYSVDTDLDAVTLTAEKGHSADLDALSTICLIKGHEKAKELIENTDGVEAVFILHDGTTDMTSGMAFEPEN